MERRVNSARTDGHPLRGLVGAALVAGLWLAGGCGAAVVSAPASVEAAQRRVDRSVSRATSSAESADAFDALLRYNPARCDCPAWELLVGEDWVRVLVRYDDGATWSSEEPTPMGTVPLRIRTTREVMPSSTGWRYPVVVYEPAAGEE
jgi:hypothetical protein